MKKEIYNNEENKGHKEDLYTDKRVCSTNLINPHDEKFLEVLLRSFLARVIFMVL